MNSRFKTAAPLPKMNCSKTNLYASVAITCDLFEAEALLAVIDSRPEAVELVITGRGADPRVIEKADLVTEMREVKHYYKAGVMARTGIEK